MITTIPKIVSIKESTIPYVTTVQYCGTAVKTKEKEKMMISGRLEKSMNKQDIWKSVLKGYIASWHVLSWVSRQHPNM